MKIKKLFTAICLLFVALSFAQNSIDVMSYNIRLGSADDGENHWNIRKDKLKDLINYYEADFIGMQEAQKPQIEYLLENNSLYGFLGKPRDEGENSEFSCIFYLKNKYKVLQQDTFWLSETPEKSTKSWDAAYPRIVTYGLFENIKTKKKIWVLNTHFDHVGVVARQKSAEIILKKIKQLQGKQNLPVVLTGDFNSFKTDTWMQPLLNNLQEASSHSITKPYGGTATWNAFNFKEKPVDQIDFIFSSKNNTVIKKFRTITDFYDFKYPSDHLPIISRIELK
ncbi:endonuclease/exonuclease/phosphatase family protein [Cloacibacterium sp.]|jgi:endonuclease/exonuclease/phosphatase family metal-dependent hydrolase|uniref:endonuclease/exonuclease/phosphatase family protein n=1 Tax=Cloacibacterium sp. TaxID=1913682 RepID=UPI0039E3BF31